MITGCGPPSEPLPRTGTSQPEDSSQAGAESTRHELSMRTPIGPRVFPARRSVAAMAAAARRVTAADPPPQQDEAVGPGDPQEPQVVRVPGEQPDEEGDQADRDPRPKGGPPGLGHPPRRHH